LHADKTQLLSVNGPCRLSLRSGEDVASKDRMVYLGGLLHSDGRAEHELSRRIGLARADFRKLARVWRPAGLSTARKLEIFDACIMSVLRYGLEAAWVNAAGRRRLDGFHARCLREILRIPPSFVSRVSNDTVYKRAQRQKFSSTLLHHQLIFSGKIAAGPHDGLRAMLLEEGSVMQAALPGPRRRGRPRDTWIQKMLLHASQAAGGQAALADTLLENYSEERWKRLTIEYSLSCG
jgi:hypothetical protein